MKLADLTYEEDAIKKEKRVRESEAEMNRELIKGRSIEFRPKQANTRSEFGHWELELELELDTILPKT